MNKSQRMQIKAFVCLLGVLLIVVLLLGRIAGMLLERGEAPEEDIPPEKLHIPIVDTIHNVWIVEEDEEGILVFYDGGQERFAWGGRDGDVADSAESGGSGEDSTSGIGGSGTYRPAEPVREQLADVTLTDGLVTGIDLKKEKISGRVLSADETGIELEGYGKLSLAADYRAYRLYGSLEMSTVLDICIGYDFTDFCLEDGEICGILLAREAATEYIRILVKASDYAGLLHAAPVATADTDFKILYGGEDGMKEEPHRAGEEITFAYDSPYFEGGRVWLIPDAQTGRVRLQNVSRSQGTPSYRGRIELLRTEEGIAVINEVLLEEYLYSVVPSEMPSGYPAEALKAQAICARTYAYWHIARAGYPRYGAHVDDSASYQVYNNIKEQASTTAAVKETYGQLLRTAEGALAETFYYSTSCGVGSDANVWKTENAPQLPYLQAKRIGRSAMAAAMSRKAAGTGQSQPEEAAGTGQSQPEETAGTVQSQPEGEAGTVQSPAQGDTGANQSQPEEAPIPLGEQLRDEAAFAAFILSGDKDDFESGEGWYRWTYKVKKPDPAHMLEVLQKRYAANSRLVLTLKDGEYVSSEIRGLGEIHDIYVAGRGAGGIAEELVIEAEEGTYKVISEHNIRCILNDGKSRVLRQDGKEIQSPNLLPSAFLILKTEKKDGKVTGYSLSGGGFGHGVGMSQNGAKEMAKSGWKAEDILAYFYENCITQSVYE